MPSPIVDWSQAILAGSSWPIHKKAAWVCRSAVPGVIRFLDEHGAFRGPDAAGVHVGFLAGALGSNRTRARALIAKVLPLAFEDQ